MNLMRILDVASQTRTFFVNPWVNAVILGIMVLGVFISFRVLDVADLSVEGILPMVAMLSIVLINAGVPAFVVLLIAVAVGALCGVLNALLTIYLKTPPLLSGIIVMALTFGISIIINSLMSGSVVIASGTDTVFSWLRDPLTKINPTDRVYRFYVSYLSYIGVGALILLIVWFVLYFFFGTELGMSIRAFGKNKEMAMANGISPRLAQIIALAISGGLIGLSSSLYGQHNLSAMPTEGQGMIVIALSSLFIGEMIIGRRTFKRSMLSVLLGSLLYWYIIQVLMLLDTQGYMLSVYKALLLILIIAIQFLLAKIKKKHPRHPKIAGGEEDTPMEESSLLNDMKASLLRHCLGGHLHA